MPYCKRTVIAGKTKEVKKYYTRVHKPGEKRIIKQMQTALSQEKVNIRKQVEGLRWILNTNFAEGDMHVKFSFKKEQRPDGYEELVKIKNKLIRDLRKWYRKEGIVFRYVYVLETGSRGAYHIHMVVKSINPKILKKCWDHGYIYITLLDETGQYGKLAAYLVKEKGRKKMEKYGGKTYSVSRNMEKPIIKKEIIRGRDFFREDVRAQKGYYVDKQMDVESAGVRKGFTTDGYPFMEYILVKINQTWKEIEG